MDESSMMFEEWLPKETHRMSGITWEKEGEAGVY